jgi:cation diffusion facilitator CzcD-associated flavoprotein CzcO
MGIQLLKAGFDDFTIYEKSDGLGGTWRDNSYPGSGCDVPSLLYSFSFEPNPNWSRVFSEQPEILAYLEHCAEKYGLLPHIRFGCEVESARFEASEGQWKLQLAGGEQSSARILVSGCGQLNRPLTPKIPGLDEFAGTVFHSARWNHEHELDGERVGVIGNGASAIQFVPRIASRTRQLQIFQRSPNWIVPKPDRPYASWEKRMFARFPASARLRRRLQYWQLESRFFAFFKNSRFGRQFQGLSRRWIREQVSDPALLRVVEPDYPIGCKRILISNDYLPTLDLPQVEVVTDPIERIEPDAVVTRDGQRRPLDTLILATGFESTRFLAPMEIRGLEGQTLESAWQDGAEAHLGMTVAGFPNFFMLYGPNTNLGHNSIIFMIECQVRYAIRCIQELQRQGLSHLDVRPEVMDAYNREIQESAGRSVWDAECQSWYKTESGKITNNWPHFTVEYWKRTRRPDFAEFRLHTPASQSAGSGG